MNKPIKSPYQPFRATKKHKREKLKQAVKALQELVKIRLAPSNIHGVGVFAMRAIKRGEKLYTDIIPNQFDVPYEMLDKLDPEIKEIILSHWPLIISGSHFLYPVCKFSAYLNHSDRPNYDAKNDKALCNIKKGEEILEDYRLIPDYKKIYTWID